MVSDKTVSVLRLDTKEARQIPWEALHEVIIENVSKRPRVTLVAHRMMLTLRAPRRGDVSDVLSALQRHGAVSKSDRGKVVAMIAACLLGAVAVWPTYALLRPNTNGASARALARSANVTSRDLPPTFRATDQSILSIVIGQPSRPVFLVNPATTTTRPNPSSTAIAQAFERCAGVTYANDRTFGRAGVFPVVQYDSGVFGNERDPWMLVGTQSQYYATERQVRDDLAQYAHEPYARCQALTLVREFELGAGTSRHGTVESHDYHLALFNHVWHTEGYAVLSLPGQPKVYVVVSALIHRHQEVTVIMMVANLNDTASLQRSVVDAVAGKLVAASSASV